MLKVKKGKIVNTATGQPVYLRGVNLGGWLMKEAYFLHAPAFAEQKFCKDFERQLGTAALKDFDKRFRDNFITRKDMKTIASWGLNCVRLPFHYNVVESSSGIYRSPGLKYLDSAMAWAKECKIYVILDLHAVPGSQNHDWHSDSLGAADFWERPAFRKRACALWQFVAKRYKGHPYLAGYDILNESVTKKTDLLNEYYRNAMAAIRKEDVDRVCFVEGNNWATDISCLDEFKDDNYALSIHSYEPLNMTFNLVPLLRYPGKQKGYVCNKQTLTRHLGQYTKEAKRRGLPVFVGEFGVNYRDNQNGEVNWLEDKLKLFNNYGFHWTYWTYKAVKNFAFPDGVFSYYENPPWVHREGPLSGWDTYRLHWRKHKNDMAKSWRTDRFRPNSKVLKVLKQYAR